MEIMKKKNNNNSKNKSNNNQNTIVSTNVSTNLKKTNPITNVSNISKTKPNTNQSMNLNNNLNTNLNIENINVIKNVSNNSNISNTKYYYILPLGCKEKSINIIIEYYFKNINKDDITVICKDMTKALYTIAKRLIYLPPTKNSKYLLQIQNDILNDLKNGYYF